MATALKNVQFCPYTLKSKESLSSKEAQTRQGVLLRCQFEGDHKHIGYADFHPYPFVSSDKELEISSLKDLKSKCALQWQQSLKMAQADALARAERRSLFKGLSLLESHYLIKDLLTWDFYHLKELRFKKFKVLKIKLGRSTSEEQDTLLKFKSEIKSDFLLRLDFNTSNDIEAWMNWEHWLNENLKSRIEFVEDPCSWSEDVWRKSRIPLALDFEGVEIQDKAPAFVEKLIWKPALGESVNLNRWQNSVVVTHLMDHPLGQLSALYMAQTHNIQTIGGFLNPGIEDSLGFHTELMSYGPWLQPEQGMGFGFDQRLKELKWQSFE